VIAKLDRLARDAHFLLGLQRSGIAFTAADMPNANRLTVGIMPMVAEEERRAISERTKAALAAAKARGVKLGGRVENLKNAELGRQKAAEARRAKTASRTADLLPVVEAIRAKGITSATGIAKALNERGIPTARGGPLASRAGAAIATKRDRIASEAHRHPYRIGPPKGIRLDSYNSGRARVMVSRMFHPFTVTIPKPDTELREKLRPWHPGMDDRRLPKLAQKRVEPAARDSSGDRDIFEGGRKPRPMDRGLLRYGDGTMGCRRRAMGRAGKAGPRPTTSALAAEKHLLRRWRRTGTRRQNVNRAEAMPVST
jgi:hypothetical protein